MDTTSSIIERSRDLDHHRGQCPTSRNVGQNERVGSLIAGGGLVLYGLTRKSFPGLVGALTGAALLYRGWTGHCSMYESLGYDTAHGSQGARGGGVPNRQGRKVTGTVRIHRDHETLYDFWRELENLPRVMRHLESVSEQSDKRSHWVARGPAGQTLEWDAEIISEKPAEMIAWESVPGSQVNTAGSVHFRPTASGEETEVFVSLQFDPPGGRLVAGLANLFGEGLEQDLAEDLRGFKQLMEAGETPKTESQPSARA